MKKTLSRILQTALLMGAWPFLVAGAIAGMVWAVSAAICKTIGDVWVH